jgi:hypothetical protein
MSDNALIIRREMIPQSIDEAIRLSEMLAKSRIVPAIYQGHPEDVFVAVQWGYEIGLAPMQALQNIAVINGKPSIYGDAALALVQRSPICEDIEEYLEGEGEALTAVCVASRKGRKPVIRKFGIQDAKRAGLWQKTGAWAQYPKRMLQMRARGFALRDAFPDVLKGLITAEEAADYPSDSEAQIPAADPAPALIDGFIEPASEPITVDPIPEEPTGEWPIHMPDGAIYSRHDSAEQWIDGLVNLLRKITRSSKLDAEAKKSKTEALIRANMSVIEAFPPIPRVRVYGELAKFGISPKKLEREESVDEHSPNLDEEVSSHE